jgi:hypothetical protein
VGIWVEERSSAVWRRRCRGLQGLVCVCCSGSPASRVVSVGRLSWCVFGCSRLYFRAGLYRDCEVVVLVARRRVSVGEGAVCLCVCVCVSWRLSRVGTRVFGGAMAVVAVAVAVCVCMGMCLEKVGLRRDRGRRAEKKASNTSKSNESNRWDVFGANFCPAG